MDGGKPGLCRSSSALYYFAWEYTVLSRSVASLEKKKWDNVDIKSLVLVFWFIQISIEMKKIYVMYLKF